jgi:hypothetical protein
MNGNNIFQSVMTLWEAEHLILQHEIRAPKNDSEKFNDATDLVPADFSFAKNEKAMNVALLVVQIAGAGYEYGKLEIPL